MCNRVLLPLFHTHVCAAIASPALLHTGNMREAGVEGRGVEETGGLGWSKEARSQQGCGQEKGGGQKPFSVAGAGGRSKLA